MTINYSYKRDIPLATNRPASDQPGMKINTNSVDDILGTDHLSFNDAPALTSLVDGMHTLIHMVSNSTILTNPPNNNPVTLPAAVTGTGELFVAQLNNPIGAGAITDTALFYQSEGGRVTQLTNFISPGPGYQQNVADRGWMSIGGILFQWGSISSAALSGTVNYTDAGGIIFPTNFLNIQLSPKSSNTGQDHAVTYLIDTNALATNNTKFKWNLIPNNSGVQYTGFYWFAIGY